MKKNKISNLEIKLDALYDQIQKTPKNEREELIKQYNDYNKQYRSKMGYNYNPFQ